MSDPVSKLAKSDPELMRFAAAAADYGSLITDRWDLVVRAGKGLGRSAPACFIPSVAEIELDADSCCKHDAMRLDKIGWTLGSIDMVRPIHRNLIPVTTGAFAHECGHSLFTLWPTVLSAQLAKEPAQLVKLALALEEGRQEARLIQRDKAHTDQMSATFRAIILPSFTKLPDDDPAALLYALALVAYRTNWDRYANIVFSEIWERLDRVPMSKSVNWSDMEPPLPTLANDSNEEMLELARKWISFLPESAKDKTRSGSCSVSCHSDDEESDDSESGEPSGTLGRRMSDLVKDSERRDKATAESAVAEAEDSEKSVGGGKATSKAPGGKLGKGTGPDEGSGVTGMRSPAAAELATARKLAKLFQSAQSVSRVKIAKKLPPGRIRGRAAVDWSRDRAMGIRSDVALFKGKAKGDDIPPIRLGIGLDVSGSMSHLTEIAASLGWTIAAAAWDSEALVSAVCFGSGVMPYATVGKAYKKVRTLQARSGMEAIGSAVEYLDNEIDLIKGDGPRILVIISDLEWVDTAEREKAAAWLQKYVKAGGTILYVGLNGERVFGGLAKGAPMPNGRTVFAADSSVESVTAAVGKLIRKAYDGM